MQFTLNDLAAAHGLVTSYMPPTPQHAWPLLAERTGAQVWVKHENHTPTGSFKVRGALTFIDWLKHTIPRRAASARRRAAITGRGRPGPRRRRG
jgi:threonine dehydratase